MDTVDISIKKTKLCFGFADQSPAVCYVTNEVLALKEAETKMVTTGTVLAPVDIPTNQHTLTLVACPAPFTGKMLSSVKREQLLHPTTQPNLVFPFWIRLYKLVNKTMITFWSG